VSVVIPGARSAAQAVGNAAAASLEPVDEETLGGLRGIYDGRIRQHVHARW